MTMPIQARFAHTNLVAHDWRKLAQFYIDVFGCVPVSSERRSRGEWVEKVTAVPGAAVDGQHLLLPSTGDPGVTLEIFEYHQRLPHAPVALNRPGFAHIAFEVDDVEAARALAKRHGARDVGELVTIDVAGAGRITLIYMADPEGNVFELQRWERG